MVPAVRRSWLLAGGVLLLAGGHLALFRHHVTDDAFISFRYLANLLAGHGLVYNPGEPVWGYTHFGWIVLLLGPVAAGMDPLATARVLGLLATAATFAMLLLRAAVGGRAEGLDWVGPALLAANGAFLAQAFSGLETSLFTAQVLGTLAVLRLARERGRDIGFAAAGLSAALATWVRPEGLFLAGLLAGELLLERSAAGGRMRRLAALLAGYLPLVLAWDLAMWSFYGAFWPNTLDAKVGLSVEQLRRGLHYGWTFALHYPLALALPIAAALTWRRARPAERTLLRAMLLFSALPVLVGGDWMLGYRLFHTPLALAAALAPLALRGLIRPRSAGGRRAAWALALAVALCVSALPSWLDERVRFGSERTLVYAGLDVGRFMRENLPPGSLLATSTGGSIPYASGLPIVDMMGLNDVTIAARRELPAEWKGIEKGDGRYVLSRRPDFIQLGSFLGSSTPLFLSGIEIYAEEEFHRHYELVEYEVAPGITLRMYRRREVPAPPLTPEERRRIRGVVARQLRLSRFRY